MSRPSGTPLMNRLYLMALVDEIGPLYALFTLWFADNGIGAAQISTVFVLWAAVAIVLELPSGAIADRVDRRQLIAVAFALRAVGISLWLVRPTFGSVLAGAMLWAVHSSLASGAWEAMIYDQLDRVGLAKRYGPVMARTEQASDVGIATGTLVAAGALGVGASIAQLGWITVATHALSIWLVLSLPVTERPVPAETGSRRSVSGAVGRWWQTLRDGVGKAARTPAVARLVVILAVVEGLFVFDEYVPLLGRDRGAPDEFVPLLVLIVWIGLLVGSELAARRPGLSPLVLGGAMVIGGGLLWLGLRIESLAAVVLLGIGSAAIQANWVIGGARLQERLSGQHRATGTSVRGFLGGIVNTLLFLMIAGRSIGDDPTPGLLMAAGLVVVAGLGAAVLVAPAIGRPGSAPKGG